MKVCTHNTSEMSLDLILQGFSVIYKCWQISVMLIWSRCDYDLNHCYSQPMHVCSFILLKMDCWGFFFPSSSGTTKQQSLSLSLFSFLVFCFCFFFTCSEMHDIGLKKLISQFCRLFQEKGYEASTKFLVDSRHRSWIPGFWPFAVLTKSVDLIGLLDPC